MISLSLAEQLKHAGLAWQPALHDFFAIPGTGLEYRVFVVSDMTIDVQRLLGEQIITFNGAVEWSLDYIMMGDVVWMPTEAQLRESLQERLPGNKQALLRLDCWSNSYRCHVTYQDQLHHFDAPDASEAYGLALLYLLQRQSS